MARALRTLLFILAPILPRVTSAQKNFFDVPSGEHAEARTFFGQTQANITRDDINTMVGMTYGLGHRADIGLTFNQWDFQRGKGIVNDREHPEESPDILINAQKAFVVNNHVIVAVGLRSGVNGVGSHSTISFADFNYVTGRYELGMHALVLGGYYANYGYAGAGKQAGVMAGVDVSVITNILHVVGDFTSGNSALGVSNAGIEIQVLKDWRISTGVQIPNHSGTPVGGIVQLSWN